MAPRSPLLYLSLRGFALGAFVQLGREVDAGAEVPFDLDEHDGFVEYRPLVRGFVESRARDLQHREDASIALEELAREPRAASFAGDPFRTLLVPLLLEIVEGCGGLDWDDHVFERAYAGIEATLFGAERRYHALAPLVGVSTPFVVDLRDDLRVRPVAEGELDGHWPEAARSLPREFGRDVDRYCVLELRRTLGSEDAVPDAAAEVAAAIAALREVTGAPAASPIVLVWLDGRPFALERTPFAARVQPPGEPIRLDSFSAGVAAERLAS